jgi:hypothetical protein
MNTGFSVTFEIVTQESAEHGCIADAGYEWPSPCSLRDAIETVLETRTCHCDGIESIEPSDSDIGQARWITVYNGMEFLTGAQESRSLHLPENLTPSTRKRIFRLLTNY